VALWYRATCFGRPKGPWRTRRRDAENDAVAQGLGEYDEWGQLYLEGPTEIEWSRMPEIKMRA